MLGLLGIVGSFFLNLVGPIAQFFQLSAPALLASTAIFMLVVICVQLSVSISGMQRQLRVLTEAIANLRLKMKEGAEPDPTETYE